MTRYFLPRTESRISRRCDKDDITFFVGVLELWGLFCWNAGSEGSLWVCLGSGWGRDEGIECCGVKGMR